MVFLSLRFVRLSRAQPPDRIFTSDDLRTDIEINFELSHNFGGTVSRQNFAALLVIALLVLLTTSAEAQVTRNNTANLSLTQAQASHFAKLALKCVAREYPNKPEHVMNDAADVQSPKSLHPAFYGCFDWHSSVHGHWMLVRLLRTFPGSSRSGRDSQSPRREPECREYSGGDRRTSNRKIISRFERTYGWAWLLKLEEELSLSSDAEMKTWSRNLQPLGRRIDRFVSSVSSQADLSDSHWCAPQHGFRLAFAFDYAKTSGNRKLAALLAERSRTYFANDRSYPGAWEPGGEDFFSPALMEADLMRRVLGAAEFRRWFDGFLPQLATVNPKACFSRPR
jgi:hypothetical protein